MQMYDSTRRRRLLLSTSRSRSYCLISRAPDQCKHMFDLVGVSNVTALDTIYKNE